MQTQGASSLWGGSSNLSSGIESNWGLGAPYSSGANNNMNLLGYGGNSLSNNPGHMQSGASSAFGDSINSNPMLGNNNRGGWGAPGTMPPSQSTNRIPSSSSGNMQGSLPVSGAQPNGPQPSQQSGAFTMSQPLGPNGVPVSSQGNSAFGSGSNSSFQKISSGNGNLLSGIGMNPATSISNGSNAQNSDNLDSSGWGMPSSSDNSRLMGTNSWGNPSSSDWDQQQSTTSMSQSQSQQLPPSSNSQYQNSNPAITSQASPSDQQRPSSWAQAAGKGLNLQPNPAAGAAGTAPSPEELQRQELVRQQIESHEGWGKKPIRQDTQWSVETSPKVQRKFSTASVVPEQQQQKGTNNMWNNNNGTAIWEANKDNNSAWSSSAPVARAPGQPPNWNGGQKPPDPSGNQWGGAGPGQAPVPNKDGSWGGAPPPPPPPDSNQSNSNNWGGSTETGSWGGNFGGAAPASGNPNSSIATWGDRENSSGWKDNQRNSGSNDGTSYWGEPQAKPPQQPPNWNPPGPIAAPPSQPPQAIGQNRGMKMGVAGWGEPIGPPDPKIDDGTSLWTSNNQSQAPPMMQARPGGWGETGSQGQWNPAVGKPKPQMPTNTAQFGGVDELNWNIPKEDVWSEESMGGWDDADMGTWNDNAQQTNSSWNSATGFNRDKRNNVKDGAMKFPGGSSHPPQMRSRLLQQLMDMGFKKDEAQHALITNNMNLQNAVSDLYNRRGAIGNKRDDDMDMFQMDGQKPRMSGAQDDISDTQPDSNSFVPNINHMQNTPFNNAQSKIPNQFPFNNGPSLSQSSLTPNNALQQKIIQKFQNQQQPPPPTPPSMNSINPTQGPMGRGQLPTGQPTNPAVHQQMAQQQILQQLRMAVQAGLISPQLLNQQLPAPVLVMLQQLLQQQQNLQQLITTQTMLQQPKLGMNPMMQRQQLDQVAARINTIKQQILLLQKNISQAQNTLLNKTSQSQQPPQPSPDQSLPESALQSEINNLTISTSQPQSRLTQWKRSTPDKESPTSSENTPPPSSESQALGEGASLDKAVGSKPISNSNSTPNLRRFDELGLSNLGGDTTWSTTPTSTSTTQNWPNTSPPTSMSNNMDGSDNKESPFSTATTSSAGNSVLDSIPAIPEFVPGKPWQGLSKNVDDDPHITPGAFARSLSVNTVNGDYLSSLTKSSPNNDSSSWPSKPLSSTPQNFSKPWSTGGDHLNAPGSFTSEIWGGPMGKGGMSRPPPGLPQQQKPVGQQWSGVNRQHSWTGNLSRPDGSWDGNRGGGGGGGGGSSAPVSTALVLKNLTPQIDGSTLRTLCMQHGPLQCFYLNQAHGQALVKYNTKEEAMKAQKSLNTCLLGNTTIVADFVSDVEALRFVELSAMSSSSQWGSPQLGHQQQHQQQNSRHSAPGNQRHHDMGMSSWGVNPPSSVNSSLSGTGMWGNNMGGGMGGSSGGLWGDTLEDNSSHNLLGNMLGETM